LRERAAGEERNMKECCEKDRDVRVRKVKGKWDLRKRNKRSIVLLWEVVIPNGKGSVLKRQFAG